MENETLVSIFLSPLRIARRRFLAIVVSRERRERHGLSVVILDKDKKKKRQGAADSSEHPLLRNLFTFECVIRIDEFLRPVSSHFRSYSVTRVLRKLLRVFANASREFSLFVNWRIL